MPVYADPVTQRLYYEEPYRMEFEARVLSAKRDADRVAIILDRTCFYPGGGGQPADRGTIDGLAVVEMRELADGTPVHLLEREPEGGTVRGAIDPAWRLDFMAQHTGQHLLSRCLLEAGGLATVSVHFGEETTAVEVAAPAVTDEALAKAEEMANAAVKENRRVTSRELPRSEALRLPLRRKPPEGERLRIVEIEGRDWAACGGVHVATTGEIFLIKIAGVERIRGRTRIHALMGRRAFADYGRKLALSQALSRVLTCGEADVLRRVEELVASERELARELKRMKEDQAATLADLSVAPGSPFLALGTQGLLIQRSFEDFGEDAVNAFLDRLLAAPGRFVVVADRTLDGFRWSVAHSCGAAVNLQQLLPPIISSLGIRGGGKEALMKGSGKEASAIPALMEAIRRTLGA